MQAGTERVARIMSATAAVLAAAATGKEPRAAEQLAADLAARLDTLANERIFADVPEALREAELQALQISLAIYAAGLAQGPSAGRTFHEAAVAFSASELAATRSMRATLGSARRKRRPPASTTALEPLGALRRAAEEGLLVDLDLAVGPFPIPDRFLALFLDARPDGCAWFDAFSLYIAWHIRSDAGLQQALGSEPPPALAALDLTVADLLERVFQQAKQTALRLEARLAEAEGAAGRIGETENREVAAFLARLPGEVAQRLQVPGPALHRAAEALRSGGVDADRLENALVRQGQRLKGLLDDLLPVKSMPQGHAGQLSQVVGLLETGEFAQAAAALRTLPETARRARAEGCCAALMGDWPQARTHGNRAIELVEPTDARTAASAGLDLAELLAEAAVDIQVDTQSGTGDPAVTGRAVDLYEAVLAVGPAHLAPSRLAEGCLGAVRCALALRKGPRQLKALTGCIANLDRVMADRVRGLAGELQARLLLARGDVLLALVGHGADRIDEVDAAFRQALPLAASGRDVRLASQAHARLAEVALLRARTASPEQAAALRDAALSALQMAQVSRLRARDPLWWAELKIRTAEVLLTIAGARSDEFGLKAGAISAKSALRLLPVELSREKRVRGLIALGGLFAALAKVEPGRRRQEQALATFEGALAAVDSSATPGVWTTILIRIGNLLVPSPEEAEAPRIADLIARYRAGLVTVAAHPLSVQRLQRTLAEALAADGKRRLDPASLAQSAALLRTVLATLTRDADAAAWSQCQMALADLLREIARLAHDAGALAEAIVRLGEVETHANETQRQNVLTSVRRRLAACRALARTVGAQSPRPAAIGDPVGQVRRLLQKSG